MDLTVYWNYAPNCVVCPTENWFIATLQADTIWSVMKKVFGCLSTNSQCLCWVVDESKRLSANPAAIVDTTFYLQGDKTMLVTCRSHEDFLLLTSGQFLLAPLLMTYWSVRLELWQRRDKLPSPICVQVSTITDDTLGGLCLGQRSYSRSSST